MNKARRKELDKIYSELEDLKSRLETVQGEEQDYLDNMPDNMRDGDKGTKAQDCVDALDNAVSEIETLMESVDNAKAES